MKAKHMLKMNFILNGLGSFFVVLGSIGIFVPVMPTTPFLLLAAACYARGSKKSYEKLVQSRILGEYIRNYRDGGGVPLSSKIYALVLLWISIGSSVLFLVENLILRIILLLIASGVSIHLITIKTAVVNVNKKDREKSVILSYVKDSYPED